jgi:hypothetical protein
MEGQHVTAATLPAGPSAGELGRHDRHDLDPQLIAKHPELARKIMTIGCHPRTGHNRDRWAGVDWRDYAALVGIPQRRGPWSVQIVESEADSPDAWVSEACGMPHVPGWYTALVHDQRGLIMSDLPAEVAGMLPFFDRLTAHAAVLPPPVWSPSGQVKVLVGGLGLGIVPAWLLANVPVQRIDVVEIDADIITLITGDPAARDWWAADPRLHVHLGDIHTWRPGPASGCQLHPACRPASDWHAAWFDIWDTVSTGNLPSMHRLHRRFGRRVSWQMSWERPECEAMRARGQTLPHPGRPQVCRALEDGYA